MKQQALSTLTAQLVILLIAGITPIRAQTSPSDFSTEPDKTMAASHESFEKGNKDKAAEQLHKAATYVKSEANEVAAGAKDDLKKAGESLDKLGEGVKNGTVKSGDELKKTFASVDHAIADGWHETAEKAKAAGEDTEHALRKAGTALDGAARWSGTELKEGAQKTVDALKEAGKKTGEGIKAGAKEVEGWLKDLGKGIKDVGRKL